LHGGIDVALTDGTGDTFGSVGGDLLDAGGNIPVQLSPTLIQRRLEAAIVALPGVDGAAAAASVMDLPDRSASNAAICDAGSSGVSSTGTVVRVVLV
jgi:hypothetical protein